MPRGDVLLVGSLNLSRGEHDYPSWSDIMTSKDILSHLSSEGSRIVEGSGTIREKWAKLNDADKEVLERALLAAGHEMNKIQEMMKQTGLASK